MLTYADVYMLTYADVCRIVAVVSSNESSEDIQVLAYVAYAVLAYVAHTVPAYVTCACPPMSPVMTCRHFTTYFTAGTLLPILLQVRTRDGGGGGDVC
jgi:uncharacterized membrane protein